MESRDRKIERVLLHGLVWEASLDGERFTSALHDAVSLPDQEGLGFIQRLLRRQVNDLLDRRQLTIVRLILAVAQALHVASVRVPTRLGLLNIIRLGGLPA
jgi:hypothetical protein